jgi:hypothetical protein
MIQGDRRLQAMRTGRNPAVRNDRRHNGHVRSQAPDPNVASAPPKAPQGGAEDDLQLGSDTESLMNRLDVMRQQGGGSSAPIGKSNPSTGAKAGKSPEPGDIEEFASVMSRIQRLLAIQKIQLRRGAGLE